LSAIVIQQFKASRQEFGLIHFNICIAIPVFKINNMFAYCGDARKIAAVHFVRFGRCLARRQSVAGTACQDKSDKVAPCPNNKTTKQEGALSFFNIQKVKKMKNKSYLCGRINVDRFVLLATTGKNAKMNLQLLFASRTYRS
jgi:hypothetical protein